MGESERYERDIDFKSHDGMIGKEVDDTQVFDDGCMCSGRIGHFCIGGLRCLVWHYYSTGWERSVSENMVCIFSCI